MPRGDKSKYTDKQKRTAEHIAVGYEERGVPEAQAEAHAWATVNKHDGGGKAGGRLARRTKNENGVAKPRTGKRNESDGTSQKLQQSGDRHVPFPAGGRPS
jgi:plasmid stabilization system protein ParE